MIYHRGEHRVRRVLRLFQSLLRFSGDFAFSVFSTVKFKDLAISLKILFGTSQIAYWILPLHDEVGEKQSEEEAEKRKRKRKGKACYTAS